LPALGPAHDLPDIPLSPTGTMVIPMERISETRVP
jgi:hypothetical protein